MNAIAEAILSGTSFAVSRGTKAMLGPSGPRLAFVSDLHCPYCGSDFEAAPQLSAPSHPDSIEFGTLECACNEYPIVEGIPIIQHVEGLESVVAQIKEGNSQRALLEAMNVFRVKWARRTKWHQLKYHLDCLKLISRTDLSFEDAVHLVRQPNVFSDYLFHRYANPSFLAAIGPLHLLGALIDDLNASHATSANPSNSIRVLDLACGAGHTSFLMRLLFPELSIFSVDHDFVSLYLAKRYLASDCTCLCLDAEVPSPFPSDYFDAVFCLDAFHYLRSKRAIVAELKRILRAEALWLFPHLHNARQQNITAGVPLAPEKYMECFEIAESGLYDEAAILDALSANRKLDLTASAPYSELNQARNLTFIGGRSSLWRIHDDFPASFCAKRSNLVMNPIYCSTGRNGAQSHTLRWPNEVMREECREAEKILPNTCPLRAGELLKLVDSDRSLLEELVAKFALVPLPPRYSRIS